MTQHQLAEAMEVKAATVTGWETGKSSPHFQVLLRLREYFQVDLESLVYRDLQNDQVGENRSSFPSHAELGATERLMGLYDELKDRMDALEGRMGKVEGK